MSGIDSCCLGSKWGRKLSSVQAFSSATSWSPLESLLKCRFPGCFQKAHLGKMSSSSGHLASTTDYLRRCEVQVAPLHQRRCIGKEPKIRDTVHIQKLGLLVRAVPGPALGVTLPTLQVQCHFTPHRLLMTENRFTPTPTGQPEGFYPDSATSSPGTRGLRVVWALTTLAMLVPALPVAPPCVPRTPPFLRSQFHWRLQGATPEPGRKRQAFFQTLSH